MGEDRAELGWGQPGVDRDGDGTAPVDGRIGDEPGEGLIGTDGQDHPTAGAEAALEQPTGQLVGPGVPVEEGQVGPVGQVAPGDGVRVALGHRLDGIAIISALSWCDGGRPVVPVGWSAGQYGSPPSRIRRGLSTIIVLMSSSLIPMRRISGRTSSGMWVHRHCFHALETEGGTSRRGTSRRGRGRCDRHARGRRAP